MSIDSADFIEGLLDEQARRNSAFLSQPGANDLVKDIAGPYPPETVGFSETVSETVSHGPHKWDDGQTAWNFWSWDT